MSTRSPNKASFQNGPDDRRGKGGYRKGAGRKPDWFKRKMEEIAGNGEAIKFLRDMVSGKIKDFVVHGADGRLIEVPVTAVHRLKAWAEAADRGFGKAAQALAISNPDGSKLVLEVPVRSQGEAGQVK